MRTAIPLTDVVEALKANPYVKSFTIEIANDLDYPRPDPSVRAPECEMIFENIFGLRRYTRSQWRAECAAKQRWPRWRRLLYSIIAGWPFDDTNTIRESTCSKGGTNKEPAQQRPPRPRGQGGTQ